MVSFAFTDEQEEFRKTLAAFSDRVLLPGYRDRAASTEFPFDIMKKIGDLGLLGIGLPEQYGGTGTEDPVLLGMATETLAYGDVNMASAPVQIGLSPPNWRCAGTRFRSATFLPSSAVSRPSPSP